MTFHKRATACKDCGTYLTVRVYEDGSIEQWVRTTDSGSWEPMPNESESNLAVPDYLTNYTCWMCKEWKW